MGLLSSAALGVRGWRNWVLARRLAVTRAIVLTAWEQIELAKIASAAPVYGWAVAM